LSGSFLDTTVVIEVATKLDSETTSIKKIINNNQPSETPYYALRELLAGYVRNICDVHNILLAADNPGEALIALLRYSPFEGRKRETKIQEIGLALQKAFTDNPSGSRDDVKRDMLQSLMVKAGRTWYRAARIKGVNVVQPLSCFNSGTIDLDSAGVLRGPRDSFNCIKSERCAAAGYLHDHQNDLIKLIEALHPTNLPCSVASKNENAQRRKALKELKEKGPKLFDKRRCRALGDAYFATMCPSGSDVITTNIEDHEILCSTLGKKAIKPE
jgi:hypothetical protein